MGHNDGAEEENRWWSEGHNWLGRKWKVASMKLVNGFKSEKSQTLQVYGQRGAVLGNQMTQGVPFSFAWESFQSWWSVCVCVKIFLEL